MTDPLRHYLQTLVTGATLENLGAAEGALASEDRALLRAYRDLVTEIGPDGVRVGGDPLRAYFDVTTAATPVPPFISACYDALSPKDTKRVDAFAALVAATNRERDEAPRAALYAGVKYTLNRGQTDPDFRYLLLDSDAHRLLVAGEAAHLGEDEEAVMARRRMDSQPSYRAARPRVVVLEERVEELEQRLADR